MNVLEAKFNIMANGKIFDVFENDWAVTFIYVP